MSTDMEWRRCKHCDKERFCSPQTMIEHEEDCPKRPSMRKQFKQCPKCGSLASRSAVLDMGNVEVWTCENTACDFTLTVHAGSKAT